MAYGTINADLMTTSDGVSSSGLYGFKNRIINGAMVIDQRSNGSSTSVQASAQYVSCDRWGVYNTQNSKCTVQQNAGSVTPPAGFKNYIGITSSSAYSSLAGDIFVLYQPIEGYNVADFGFGSAGASSITISFWVRSSLTGTFGGSLQAASNARTYPFTYTISAANTWEQKSVTIAGDISGSWNTTNGVGLTVNFNLGTGTTNSGPAGAWSSTGYFSATGATSVVGTNGATFYITGVQLEKGSTATSFDYRPFGTELGLCQRYYHKSYPQTTAPADSAAGAALGMGASVIADANSVYSPSIPYPICMRATPTFTFYRTPNSATSGQGAVYTGTWQTGTSTTLNASSDNRFSIYVAKTSTFTAGYSYLLEYAYSATAEL